MNAPKGIASEGSTRQPVLTRDVFCPECGYNLRGLLSNHCPECGTDIDYLRTAISQIPWIHRRKLGLFRTYWRTASQVMFHGRRFCAEIAIPVDFREAQRFRWFTIAYAWVPFLFATIWIGLIPLADPALDAAARDAFSMIWPVIACHVFILLFLAAATGLPSYFFHPPQWDMQTQNNAVALSYYTSGSLAVTWTPVFCLCASQSISFASRWHSGLNMLAVLVIAVQWIGWWIDLLRIQSRLMLAHRTRRLAAFFLIPLLWILLLVLIFGGLGLITTFFAIVLTSLW